MKEQYAFIKDNLAVLTVAGYGFGLLYMSIFYYFFDVPIVNYLSLNDILLTSVTLIIPVLIALFFLEYISRELKLMIYKRELNYAEEAIFSKHCVVVIIGILITSYVFEKVRINPNLLFYILFISFVLIAKLGLNIKGTGIIFPVAVSFFGFTVGVYILITYGKAGFANKDVKFNYYEEVISTGFSNDLNYIGETSTTIFLHNFKKKVTYVYEKSNISKLQYRDKIEKDFSPKKDIELYALKTAKYKVATDTIYKPFEWSTYDYKTFWWTAEKNAVGLSRLMWEINYILDENDFDFEDPTHSHSSLPAKMIINEDFKATSDALNSGNCEVHKEWENNSGKIDLQLNKKYYSIQIEFKKGKGKTSDDH